MPLPRIILAATDFSEHADRALEYAADLAVGLGAELHVVHAVSLPALGVPEMGITYASMMESMLKEGKESLAALEVRYRGRLSLAGTHLELGDPREVVVRIAEVVHADLIVMGTHGRRGLRRALLGSVAESVVRSAPCPVLIVRPPNQS